MRILHTSDWHLGRTLHKVPLGDAQRAAMTQIAQIAEGEAVDLVVVSGDVFDHAVPSAEALELLEDTLSALVKIAPTVVTAGNHDSLRRLGYGSRLFTERLHLHTRTEDVGCGLTFADEHGPVRVYPIPYLHPDAARHALAEGDEPLPAAHSAVLRVAMDRVLADLSRFPPNTRSVVLAHAWVAGGSATDSERDVSVGGLGTVPSDVFDGVDYVALGHLHRPQEVRTGGHRRIRYSGSPLRYSFSEAEHEKSVCIVELDAEGVADVREVPIRQPRAMANLRGLMDELLDPDLFREHLDSWVSVSVADDRRPARMWPRIQQRFAHALLVRHEPAEAPARRAPEIRGGQQKPGEVVGEFVRYVTNGEIDPGEEAAFDAAVQVVRDQESA
ncbi:MAG TPA: exonuclease SbcCD subunit D [Actinomycetota bacterium]|nr:exonuclease SbcCD subunit D [Actinomycetota bacterium]